MDPIKIREFPGCERIRFFADHDELIKFLAEIRWNLVPQLELHVDDPSVSVQVYANRNGNKSIVGAIGIAKIQGHEWMRMMLIDCGLKDELFYAEHLDRSMNQYIDEFATLVSKELTGLEIELETVRRSTFDPHLN
jgi:hypothetical protein